MLNSALGAKETEVNKTGECLPTHVDTVTGVAKCARLQVESDVGDREKKGLFYTMITWFSGARTLKQGAEQSEERAWGHPPGSSPGRGCEAR